MGVVENAHLDSLAAVKKPLLPSGLENSTSAPDSGEMARCYLVFQISFVALTLAGCAATPRYGSETPWVYERSNASAASYGADSYTFGKVTQPLRPRTAEVFYYKSCGLDDAKTFYSKTSYICSDPH